MQKDILQPPSLIVPQDMKLQPKKITTDDLKRKFEEFKNDNTNLDKVQKQNLDWLQPGVIVELFCGDFSDMSLLSATDSFYKRYTGIVKILSASKENARIAEIYGTIKPGDIAYIGDDALNIVINPAWQHWHDTNGRGVMKGQEPIKYIRKFHRWIEHGMLYLVDRDQEVINKEGLEITLATIGDLNVPMIFRLPVQDILCRIENPFN
jgi:hypothetical protein